MWYQESFFKYTVGIILVLTIIALLYHTSPVFHPILWFVAAILLPILFSTLLYYILRPVVNFLNQWIPRYPSIVIVYLILGLLTVLLALVAVPKIAEESKAIMSISPDKVSSAKDKSLEFIRNLKDYIPISQMPAIEEIFLSYIQKINTIIYQLGINTITTLASVTIALAMTPFVLYYFLRDDHLFSRFILRFVPVEFHDEIQKILEDIDQTLSQFILAQLTVAVVIGFFLFIGYHVIGLPHATALALFAMIFYIIPILGTFIAIIPALIVGMTISLSLTFKVVLVMFIAHFVEANMLTPKIMSLRLKIHPLTVILLLLAAGSLWGLLGLLLVTPTYAILKVIVWNLYKISRLRYAMAKSKHEVSEPIL